MLPDSSTLIVFVPAALALLLVPGPAVLYIVARSVDQGRRAGIVSALGIALGTFVHILAAALGVSALLMSSALAFQAVKLLGAAYLIVLGVRKLLERDTPQRVTEVPPQALSRVFYQGTLVNVLNPKAALFFFAFLPQFIDPARGPASVQIVVLGVIFVLMALCSDGTYALLAGTLGGWLRDNAAFWRGQRLFAGGVYIALGVATAVSGGSKK